MIDNCVSNFFKHVTARVAVYVQAQVIIFFFQAISLHTLRYLLWLLACLTNEWTRSESSILFVPPLIR